MGEQQLGFILIGVPATVVYLLLALKVLLARYFVVNILIGFDLAINGVMFASNYAYFYRRDIMSQNKKSTISSLSGNPVLYQQEVQVRPSTGDS